MQQTLERRRVGLENYESSKKVDHKYSSDKYYLVRIGESLGLVSVQDGELLPPSPIINSIEPVYPMLKCNEALWLVKKTDGNLIYSSTHEKTVTSWPLDWNLEKLLSSNRLVLQKKATPTQSEAETETYVRFLPSQKTVRCKTDSTFQKMDEVQIRSNGDFVVIFKTHHSANFRSVDLFFVSASKVELDSITLKNVEFGAAE